MRKPIISDTYFAHPHHKQVVIYESGARFSLMSNSPQADIEIILHEDDAPTPNTNKSSTQSKGNQVKDQSPVMRIQYSRQRQFLEVAERLVGDRGTEWKKCCKPCFCLDDISALLLGDEMNSLARKGLRVLLDLLESCRHLEEPAAVAQERTSLKNLRTQQYSTAGHQDASSSELEQKNVPDAPATRLHALLEENRYLSSVGWCKRISGSGSSKYMLMFFDGTSMLVDIAEDSVCFLPRNGNQITYFAVPHLIY